MMQDPDVIADAESEGLEPSLMTGEQIESLGRDIGTLPPDLIERMKPLLERKEGFAQGFLSTSVILDASLLGKLLHRTQIRDPVERGPAPSL